MKFSSKILLVLAASTLFFACKKDDNNPDSKGTLTCKIDGTAWSAADGQAAITVQQGLTNISGKAADGTLITMTLMGVTKGTYQLLEGGDHVGVYAPNSTTAAFASNQGADATAKVVISEINTTDSTMSGTFQYTAFREIDNTKKVITEGKFTNVKFKTEVNNTTAGTFKCKIDGVQFTAGLTSGTLASGYLLILGSASSGVPGVSLYLNPNIAVGTTNLEGAFGANFGQYNKTASQFLSSDSGKVTITKHDKTAKKIEGTFNFMASELLGSATANITEGSFSIKY